MFKILEKLTAKNKKQDDIRMPSHLSAAEQKQVQTVIDRARGDRTVPHSAQESIPFQRMFPDGICRVTDNYYTKTIQYQDINYQLPPTTPAPSSIRTSITSWHNRKIRQLSLRNGAAF